MSVHRRHVLFLAGFDPKGAAYYHGLYQREAAKQAQVTPQQRCTVGPRQRSADGNHRWQVQAQDASTGQTTETTVEHLRWDDLVRREWPKGAGQVAWGSLLAYAHALSLGRALLRVWRVAPMPLVALAWPGLCWLGLILAVLGLTGLLAGVLSAAVPGPMGLFLALAGAVLLLGGSLRQAWQLEKRWNTTWLLRIYRFADRWARQQMPGMDQRVQAMAERLGQVLADPELDEVLVVGYSVGSILAISMVAKVLDQAAAGAKPSIALLTLGHCVPLSGLTRGSSCFRQELGRVASAQNVHWVDVSSPTDWGSFALVDPVWLCLDRTGINPRSMVSPRFHTLFAPQRYQQLRRDKRRMHLQYLMAGERPGGYNFFDITAGPRRLMEHPWNRQNNAQG